MSKITLPRSVVEQALEALFMYKPMVTGVTFQHGLDAMQALRAALEQPQVEQEPVAFVRRRVADDFSIRLNRVVTAEDFAGDTKQFLAWCEAHAERDWTPLYTHPQPPRQPLTDEWIRMIYDECDAETGDEFIFAFARAIEAAHGIGGEQ